MADHGHGRQAEEAEDAVDSFFWDHRHLSRSGLRHENLRCVGNIAKHSIAIVRMFSVSVHVRETMQLCCLCSRGLTAVRRCLDIEYILRSNPLHRHPSLADTYGVWEEVQARWDDDDPEWPHLMDVVQEALDE